jgi:ribose 5-phosphate isomerase B
MKIAIASDHAGYELKEDLILFSPEIEWKDFGAHSLVSVDYPDYGFQVAQAVARQEFECGVLICGSGIGMSMTANKVKGIRAALCHDIHFAKLCKLHNNANILVLPGRFISKYLAKEMLDIWLSTEFAQGRHLQRIDKIRRKEEELK